jgi:polar amino acid transport system substrate-binding protein
LTTLKRKHIRSLFFAFVATAIIVLISLNYHRKATFSADLRATEIVVMIFIISLICVCYFVYEAYQIISRELVERLQMLESSRNDLQITYDSIPVLLIRIDRKGRITNVNEEVCRYFDRPKKQILGRTLSEGLNFKPQVAERLSAFAAAAFQGEDVRRDEITAEGGVFEVMSHSLPDADGVVRNALLTVDDITESRAIYQHVQQENKMAAVGQLAAGVAHEIRNPLGLIRNYAFLLKRAPHNTDENMKMIERIESEVERSGSIIDNLLRFSSISGNDFIEVNVRDAIDSIITLHEPTIREMNIRIEVSCPDGITLKAYPVSLSIIFANLLANAIDGIVEARKADGLIVFSCEAVDRFAYFCISDNGCGIPESIREHIFNPFFTTKRLRRTFVGAGPGSGLGLYIVYSEVNRLHGTVYFYSTVGKGTVFEIILPI